MTLSAGVCTFSLTLGAKAISVAVASGFCAFVTRLAVTRVALKVSLIATGRTVKDRFLQCARPQRLYGDKDHDQRNERHQRGEYYYGFLV